MYAEMLPRLRAEELLETVDAVAAGTAKMKRGDRRKYMARLKRQARGGRREKARKPTAGELEAIGIQVVSDEESDG